MNYQKHYDLLISSRSKFQKERTQLRKLRRKQLAESRTYNSYFEKHHIIPKCLNGTNDESNLILLTPREHYISHWLLAKIYPKNYKLSRALLRLSYDKQNNYIQLSSKKYELVRIHYNKTNSGVNSPMYGKTRSIETREKISKSHMGKKLPDKVKRKLSILNTGELNPNFGKKHSIETRNKMSLARTGDKNHMYGKYGIAHHNFGKHLSNEIKEKISKNMPKLKPWETNRVKSTNIYNWYKLDLIYEIWIRENFPKSNTLCVLSMAEDPKITKSSGFSTMIKWFNKNGNPSNDNSYILFKENFINN